MLQQSFGDASNRFIGHSPANEVNVLLVVVILRPPGTIGSKTCVNARKYAISLFMDPIS